MYGISWQRIYNTLDRHNKKAGLFVWVYKSNKFISSNITILARVVLSPNKGLSREARAEILQVNSREE